MDVFISFVKTDLFIRMLIITAVREGLYHDELMEL